MKTYIEALFRIPRLAFASFGITLLAKACAAGAQRAHGHSSAFDDAVGLLLHYPEALKGIIAFLGVVLILLCVTIVIEPSYLGRKSREWILLPSIHTAEHMISLALGVFAAWAVIDTATIGVPYGSFVKTGAALVIGGAILFVLAAFCAAMAEFLTHDYDAAIDKLGSYRFAILIVAGALALCGLYADFVWNYSPAAAASGGGTPFVPGDAPDKTLAHP